MKQTAVEWLIERLMDGQVDNKMLAQAKEMEREQQSYSEEDMKLMFEFGYRNNNFIESTFKDALNYIEQKKK